MKRISLIWLLLAITILTKSVYATQLKKWEKKSGYCPAGIHKPKNSPFAVILFCESALGTYLSLMYMEPITSPITPNGKWGLNDRYWHDAIWGSDVTEFRWSKDGEKLYISTSNIYGSGGYFVLNLKNRAFTQTLPKDKKVSLENIGPGYSIHGKEINE